jgi:iron complex outermembrane receptor protein
MKIGYKSVIDGGRLSIEAALFSPTGRTSRSRPAPPASTSSSTAAPRAAAAPNWPCPTFPINGLSLRGAVGYTDAKLTENAPAAGGLDGDRLPFVPKMTGSIGANYRFPVAAAGPATSAAPSTTPASAVPTSASAPPRTCRPTPPST